jgi:hypothetical protein
MTQFPDLFAALAAPFDPQQVRSRSQANRQVSYITARTAMNRLDDALGPENWWDEYHPGENSVLCRLTIRLPDGSTLTKADAGGYAGMPDQGDDDKSGFSDSFKRAAVKFGVGRYLYRDGVPSFAREAEPGPAAPARPPKPPAPAGAPAIEGHVKEKGLWGNGRGQTSGTTAPRSGRALFAWIKEQEQRHEVGLLQHINAWAKLQDFPGRMVDWGAELVNQGYAEAVRKLRSAPAGHPEAPEEARP